MDKRVKSAKELLKSLEIKPDDSFWMIDLKTILKKEVLATCKLHKINIKS